MLIRDISFAVAEMSNDALLTCKTLLHIACRGFDFKQDTYQHPFRQSQGRTQSALLQTNKCEANGFVTPDRPTNGLRTPDLLKWSTDEEMDREPDMNKLRADLGPDLEVVAGKAAEQFATPYTWLHLSG